jgi:hypothetical protein
MQVIVCDEKHGDFLWDASTLERWAASALSILTERFTSGDWYTEPALAKTEARADELRRLIEQTTDEYLKSDLQRRLVSVERDLHYERDHAAWYAEAKRVVDEQDVSFSEGRRLGQTKKLLPKGWPVAWALLHHRREHEYERVRLDDVRQATVPA